jgi:hypothetical protein
MLSDPKEFYLIRERTGLIQQILWLQLPGLLVRHSFSDSAKVEIHLLVQVWTLVDQQPALDFFCFDMTGVVGYHGSDRNLVFFEGLILLVYAEHDVTVG